MIHKYDYHVLDSTVLSYEEDLVNVSDDYSCSSSTSSQISQPSWGSQNMENADSYPYDWSTLLTTLNMTSIDSLDSTESVYELNENFNIVLQGLIGQVIINIWYNFLIFIMRIFQNPKFYFMQNNYVIFYCL